MRKFLCNTLCLLAISFLSEVAIGQTNAVFSENTPILGETNALAVVTNPVTPPANAVIVAPTPATTAISPVAAAPLTAPRLPDAGISIIRVFGALALVIGIFLGGVWLFRNWQRLAIQRGRAPKLNVLETRSLGGRQAIFVVGYEQERFLIASSPTGINLLSHLPQASGENSDAPAETTSTPSFSQTLAQMLKRK